MSYSSDFWRIIEEEEKKKKKKLDNIKIISNGVESGGTDNRYSNSFSDDLSKEDDFWSVIAEEEKKRNQKLDNIRFMSEEEEEDIAPLPSSKEDDKESELERINKRIAEIENDLGYNDSFIENLGNAFSGNSSKNWVKGLIDDILFGGGSRSALKDELEELKAQRDGTVSSSGRTHGGGGGTFGADRTAAEVESKLGLSGLGNSFGNQATYDYSYNNKGEIDSITVYKNGKDSKEEDTTEISTDTLFGWAYSGKYNGKTYAEIQDAISKTTGRERTWLEENQYEYMSSAEAQKEIDYWESQLATDTKKTFGGATVIKVNDADKAKSADYDEDYVKEKISFYKSKKTLAERREKFSVMLSEMEKDKEDAEEVPGPTLTGEPLTKSAYGDYVVRGEKADTLLIQYRTDPQKLVRDSAQAIRTGGGDFNRRTWLFATQMTEDEYNNYLYFLGKYGEEKADEYLGYIEETINARQAGFIVESVGDSAIQKAGLAIGAGLDQFGSGINALFSGADYIPATATQIASAQVREGLKDSGPEVFGQSLGQAGYDFLNTTSNMLPSIIISGAAERVAPGSGKYVGSALMGASAAGHTKAELLNLGYSQSQATSGGLMVGVSEAGLQSLIGGITSLGGTASKGLTEKIASKVNNAIARAAITLGGSMAAEGFEEGLQTVLEPWLKEIATGVDWEDAGVDEVLYSSLLGALSSAGIEGPGAVKNAVSGQTNIRTDSEQKVFEAVLEERINKAEQNGEKLTKSEIAKLEKQVQSDIDKGRISIATINNVLAGDSYKAYIDEMAREDAELSEYESLLKKKETDYTKEDTLRFNDLQSRLDDIKNRTKSKELGQSMYESIHQSIKDGKLGLSYQEAVRENEQFTVDLDAIDPKERETYKAAMESGAFNNSGRSHEAVSMFAKHAAKQGVKVHFTTEAKMMEEARAKYSEGELKVIDSAIKGGLLDNLSSQKREAFIKQFANGNAETEALLTKFGKDAYIAKYGNGFRNKSTGDITYKVGSQKGWRSTFGHEIMHSLEKTKHYGAAQKALFAFSKKKGDFDTRRADIAGTYNGVYDSDIETDIDFELTADLAGDYIFTDAEFAEHLYNTDKNVFQKVFDEIKYWFKLATTGSEEARLLEKAKHNFEKALRSTFDGKASTSAEGGIQHSLKKDIDNFDNSWYNELKLPFKEQERVQSEALRWHAKTRNQLITQTLSNEITYRYVIDDDGIVHIYEKEQSVNINDWNDDYGNTNTAQPDSAVEELWAGQGYNGVDSGLSQDGRESRKDDSNDNHVVSGKGRSNGTGYSKNRTYAYRQPKAIGYHFNEDGSVETEYSDGTIEIDDIAPTKEASSTDGVFFDGENEVQHSLSKDSNGNGLSDGQKEFFKDTKVRDENGNLKVMYHGTSNGGHTVFDTYGSKYGLFGVGSYFTDSKTTADSYTKKGKGSNPQVYESYLNIKNPIDMDAQADPAAWQKALPEADFPESGTNEDFYIAMEEHFEGEGLYHYEAAESTRDILESMGYDGITHIGGGRVNADGERHQVYIAFHPDQIKNIDNSQPTADPDVRYSITVSDQMTVDFLENQEHITTYKAMQLVDGKLYPPMAGKVKDENGRYQWSNPSQLGVWQQATEDPANIKKVKNGVGYYTLNKGDGSSIDAAYNPYEHSSNLVLNDQFESAYRRDNLVTVECVIPVSEMSSGYKAEYAKDGTGVMDWKSGVVAGQIKDNKRQVYLSRYLKPVRILSDAETAIKYKEALDGTGVSVPFNVVTPSLLTELEKVGVDIDYEGSPNYRYHQSKRDAKKAVKYSLSKDSEGRELSSEQQDYFALAKTRDENGVLKPFYHGTRRADRVGTVFDPSRATSGPMAYFTDNRTIADHYARDKADTSLAYDSDYDSYETQFRVTRNGKDMSVVDLWYTLPMSERNAIKEKAKHITMDDDWDKVIYSEETQHGLGNFDAYELNRHRGNALHTLVDSWLTDGNIFGEEHKFLDVLKLVGIEDATYKDPDFRDEKTYEVYLNITNPFDTSNISEEMVEAFRQAAEEADFAPGNSADMWDKRNVNPELWMERLEDDIKNGTTNVWTSIPDFVTDVLKAHGYDGIFDTGGKFGGEGHTVAIPFYSEQIKSVDNRTPTSNIDINLSMSDADEAPVLYGDDVRGTDLMYREDIAPTLENVAEAEVASPSTVEEDIAPIMESTPVKEEYEAIRPSRQKYGDKLVRREVDIAPTVETTEEAVNRYFNRDIGQSEKIAKTHVKEETAKEKNRSWSQFRRLFLDKGSVFEDLSLKTKNREIQGKWQRMLTSESRAQKFIGDGKDGVKSIKSLYEEIETSGKSAEFDDYCYHLLNTDRMSLESRAQAEAAEIRKELYDYAVWEIEELANKRITKNTPKERADLISKAKDYISLMEVKNKPVFGDDMTAEISKGIAERYEAENPEFKQWSQEVYALNRQMTDMAVEKGLVAQETADLWAKMYPHYVPIHRVGKNGKAVNVPLDTGRTGVNTPFKRAEGGNSDIAPMLETMASRAEQIFKAIDRNSFGVELKNALGTTVERNAVDFDGVMESVDNQDGLLQKGENGSNPTFSVFEKGNKITFEITEDMYDALKASSEVFRTWSESKPAKVLQTASSIHRGLLTEYNPVFMLTNAVKDVQDVLLNSQHAVKTYANIPIAIREMATNGKYYQEYMENGGDQNTYFEHDSKSFVAESSKIKKIVGIPFEAISKANNVIEMTPRLAEYIASRKQGRSIDVSMLDAARVTTNFQAGGDVTKFANRNGVTFLNASVQGAMQQVRNVREAKANGLRGWVTLVGRTIAAGLPALLINGLMWEDDEEYEELSDYVKDNYYVIAKTEDGKFIRIPKGRAVAVIQDAITQIMNASTGNDEADLKGFIELAISNLAPNNPLDNNVLSPIAQVASNKTWYGEDLVPTRLQDLPNEEQFDESTDAFSKWLGETFGVSPYKANYLLNQYTGGVGDVVLPMLTPEAESGDDSPLGNVLAPLKSKFTTDSVFNNQNVSDFYDKMDELTTNAKSSKATDNDIISYKYMNAVNAELGELYAMKREIQNSELSDSVKYQRVREIQEQIIALTKEGLGTYGEIGYEDFDGERYATVGGRYYKYDDEDGEWQKLTDSQVTKYEAVKNAPKGSLHAGSGDNQYRWYVPEDTAVGEWRKITDKELEKQNFYTKAIGIEPGQYWEYSYALNGIKADKDEDGKSISGSAKEKKIEYINSLDIDYGSKLVLFKCEYPADDTYNNEIVNYLDSREDISYEEMVAILTELGFRVNGNTVSWD